MQNKLCEPAYSLHDGDLFGCPFHYHSVSLSPIVEIKMTLLFTWLPSIESFIIGNLARKSRDFVLGALDGAVEKVLSGCPNLEHLELQKVSGIQRLEES
ncbi:hypothetical protein RDI58_019674 [Solanum bulbocastanum]|uniref:Uncharacterized protein n=1 Tax=Solanum bulbocastanum TaxID=147425 RepID=A0AAN8T4W9_SOLBU